MRNLVWEALLQTVTRETALNIITGLCASGPGEAAGAIDTFLRVVTLIGEPDEMLISPGRLLDMIEKGSAYADCDDVAMLAAALLASIGIQTRFKAVMRDFRGGHFRHVFTEYKLGEHEPWRPLDPTVTGLKVYGPDCLILEV